MLGKGILPTPFLGSVPGGRFFGLSRPITSTADNKKRRR